MKIAPRFLFQRAAAPQDGKDVEIMKKPSDYAIVPHLWFDTEAGEAVEFYVSLFENSRLVSSTILKDTPSGDAEAVRFELAGQPFEAISGGPAFKLNPSISLMVAFSSSEEVDRVWNALAKGGKALMELGEYPFSRRYGWIEDRYGLSWQLMLADGEMPAQRITPNLLFSNEACGKAEQAVGFYAEVFPDSRVGLISKYREGEADSPDAKVNFAGFKLRGQDFAAMDNGYGEGFGFSAALSLIVYCADQREVDYYWDRLSAVPEAEACGWVMDKFGVSWQIVPRALVELMESGDEAQADRVLRALLEMKKIDIEALERAYEGR
jgi:predicted 3-demethylubiquinone-9 3-methyltransferase (glyoxalase superfamily)